MLGYIMLIILRLILLSVNIYLNKSGASLSTATVFSTNQVPSDDFPFTFSVGCVVLFRCNRQGFIKSIKCGCSNSSLPNPNPHNNQPVTLDVMETTDATFISFWKPQPALYFKQIESLSFWTC